MVRASLSSLVAVALLLIAPLPGAATCPPSPSPRCRGTERGTLDVRRNASAPTQNAVRWRWTKGAPTLAGGFGFTTAADDALCVYDAGGLVLEATFPAGGTCGDHVCWDGSAEKGFTYKDSGGAHDGVQRVKLRPSAAPKASIKLDAKGANVPAPALPFTAPVTVQLVPAAAGACFASTFGANDVRTSTPDRFKGSAKSTAVPVVTPLPSGGCGAATTYATGENADTLDHDGLTRTFGVYLPPSYDLGGGTPMPVVVVLHGGFGSGEQVFTNAQMAAAADDTGAIVVYPDGVLSPAGIRAWNAGGCCGYPVANDVDDVGFIAALLDAIDARLCVDDRRVFVTGMSNGAMLAYRVACELSARVAAIAPVAGAEVTSYCSPTRPMPVMHVHGTADMNVPWDGGFGCGPSGYDFPSVATTIGGWTARDGCAGAPTTFLDEGDGHCARQGSCPAADVVLCAIDGGGHTWPGALPLQSQGFPNCPFGPQSTTFDATRRMFDFFSAHPLR